MCKLTVIIVNFNVKSYLQQALRSIIKSLEGIPAQIIVVDNGSTDGSIEMIQEHFPDISLIKSEQNLGFSRANNLALKQAEGKYICLVNPDTIMNYDTFKICLEFLNKNSKAGAVGCKILNSDGTLQLSCRRSIPTPWIAFTKFSGLSRIFPKTRLFGRYNLTFLDENQTSEVEALSGSFMIVRKKTILDVGLLDESFFMYGEDLDWCYRFRQNGWKIYYIPDTSIIHYKGKSSQSRTFKNTLVFYDAMRIFVKKHFKQGWLAIPGWFLIIGIWIKGLFSFLAQLLKKTGYWLTDIILLQIGLLAAIYIRFGHLLHWESYKFINVVYTVIWITLFAALGLYGKKIFSNMRAVSGVLAGLVINSAVTFFFPQYAFSRQVIISATVLNTIFITGWRGIYHSRFINRLPNLMRGHSKKRALLVGNEPSLHDFFNWNKDNPDSHYHISGIISWAPFETVTIGKLNQLGSLFDIERIVSSHKIDEIIFASERVGERDILLALFSCRSLHLQYKFTTGKNTHLFGMKPANMITGLPLFDFNPAVYTDFNVYAKRLFDIFISLLLLPNWLLMRIFIFFSRQHSIEKQRISDGGNSYLTTNVFNSKSKKIKGWKVNLPLIPEILKGTATICGTPVKLFEEGMPGSGYKPGLTSILFNKHFSGDAEDEARQIFNYLNHYSMLLDFKLLIKMFKS